MSNSTAENEQPPIMPYGLLPTLRTIPSVSEINNIFRRLLLLTLAFVGLVGCDYSASSELGRVTGVIDGDSVRVRSRSQNLEVRLGGIDAPEYRQPHGEAAKRLLTELVANEAVRLIGRDRDRYGRTIAILVRADDDLVVNAELIRRGAAWAHPEFAEPSWFILERQARSAKRGLWSGIRPVPPWEWRREHGTTHSRK